MLDAQTPARPRQISVRWALVVGAGMLALGATSLALWLTSRTAPSEGPRPLSAAAFAEATGVKVLRIAVVGGGGILDVRYQVVHGAAHQGEEASIALVDEETGLLLADGVHGKHSGNSVRPEAVRYILIANTAGTLEPGETASVAVGDVKLEGVPVQ